MSVAHLVVTLGIFGVGGGWLLSEVIEAARRRKAERRFRGPFAPFSRRR